MTWECAQNYSDATYHFLTCLTNELDSQSNEYPFLYLPNYIEIFPNYFMRSVQIICPDELSNRCIELVDQAISNSILNTKNLPENFKKSFISTPNIRDVPLTINALTSPYGSHTQDQKSSCIIDINFLPFF